MQRRSFLKFFTFLLTFFSFKLSSSNNKEKILFNHGVASGDPTNTNVIIWTRISKISNTSVNVNWEISDNKNFKKIISSGKTKASAHKDFTIKVDARIPEKYNGSQIFYRFVCNNYFSPVGSTITLPIDNPDLFNIAFCSCSNYPAGFFNAYKEMAKNKDIDLVLHLGDYLYEYDKDGYASENSNELNRVSIPSDEIISLNDYRLRHAQYKTDQDLQLLHKNKPMIVVWDDHEFTNDTWKSGAQNHSRDEGNFLSRKINALKAYYEWMPIRESGNKTNIWRSFEVGNLFQLLMLDTRLISRDKQLDINDFYTDGVFDYESYKKALKKPRKLLGNKQFSWIKNTLDKKYKWSIFGQQILIGPQYLPDALKKIDKSLIPEYMHIYLQLAGKKLPWNTDQWDGYPKEREKFYKIIQNSQSNIILAGDTHSSWLSNLYDAKENFIGIEIGAPSISSPNGVDLFGDYANQIDNQYLDENDNLIYTNSSFKGYALLSLNKESARVVYKYVSTVKSVDYKNIESPAFDIQHNQPIKINA
ncbi:alkaline phosphatase D family protein [Gammaproteobacteria bacterium]|nr:alkaline phosphatase D family protein [Gammaproteobacteria bacterium]